MRTLAVPPKLSIVIVKSSARRLRDMPPANRAAALRVLASVSADPAFRHNALRALKGVAGGFRLRTGDWRVSFTVDRDAGILEVFEIETRGRAYR